MGKGKKKGDKKKEEIPSVSTLSVSDQPSTSQEPPPPVVEEESGLTGGAKSRRAKKASTTPEISMTPPPTQPAPIPIPAVPAPEVKEEERPIPIPDVPAPEVKEEEFEGLGIGGGKKRGRRTKKKDDAQAKKTPSEPAQAMSEGPPSIIPTPGPSRGMSMPPQSVPSHKLPASAPSKPYQELQSPAGPIQQFSSQPVPGMQMGDGRKQGTWGRGRGRGVQPSMSQPTVGQQMPGIYGPSPQMFMPHPAQAQYGVRAQSPPSAPQQVAPAVRPQQKPHPIPTQQKPSATVSLYTIPPKILGRTVPFSTVDVLTNYLPMTIKPLKIYRYDVSFAPDRPKKALSKAFTIMKDKYYRNHVVAFDQVKNCYALKSLPNVPANERFAADVEVKDEGGKIMKFEVSLKATGIVDLKTIIDYMEKGGTSLNPPTEAIQCIDVVLRQATLDSYIKAGRQFFKRPANPINLGDGLEMWTGLFQSAIFATKPYVNVDVAHKGFPKQQPLISVLAEFRLDPRQPIESQRGRGAEMFLNFIKGLKVEAFVGGDNSSLALKRTFICNDIKEPCNRCKFLFTDQSGKQRDITVYDYFTKERKCQLRYPNLNCMWVGPRDRSIYYPIELLEVAYGQVQNKQLNEMQLSTMVKMAATPPDDRKRKIEEIIRNINYSQNPIFKQFGLEIGNSFLPLNAKVLEAPKLDVGEGRPVQPRNGSWRADKFVKAEALERWGFIAIDVDPRSNCDFEGIIGMVMKSGRFLGMKVMEPTLRNFNVNIRDLTKVLFTALEKGVRFLFVIVSQRGRDHYHRVKKLAECEVGILTQCVKEQTASRRMNPQTVKNILLKVNSKLMGINQTLANSSTPRCIAGGGVMVVGADVTHPSPDQTSVPSIAAVTASIDPKCFVYNIEMSVQTPKKEMIVEFEDIMMEHLRVYKHEQNALPRKIFVFRDGVSEGQYAELMQSELRAVYKAYARLAGEQFVPEVLFLVVQKRHHTRLFQGRDRVVNVSPGTVVDTHIVHAKELDFYLVSHEAIKGTARPTRYHAVSNTGSIPHDEVEQLTYYLCHLYSRCMRAVSYPTPTYYAHLACMRARSLTYGDKFDNLQLEKQPKRLDVNKILKFSRMFFV